MEVSRGSGAKSEKTRCCTPAEGGISFLQDGMIIPSQGEDRPGMNLGSDTPGRVLRPGSGFQRLRLMRPTPYFMLVVLSFEV